MIGKHKLSDEELRELREAAHVEITGCYPGGLPLNRRWSRPRQVLIDYIAALEERLKDLGG